MVSRILLPLITLLCIVGLYAAGPVGRFLVSGSLTLFVPGYVIWSFLRPEVRLSRLASPSIWLALSLSIIPIGFLWGSTFGLSLTANVLRLQAFGLALLALWYWSQHQHRSTPPPWLLGAWLLILALTALTRWLEIRGVAAPLWVDSVHHTLLVRIIGETGRIPTSLQPYLPVEHLMYHWGYHTVVAAWRGIADFPFMTAVLWSGQILNALIALAMYGLGAYILRSPRGGLITAAVAGLLSLMPAYYVTWGRYTQLTGLLLLPGLLIASFALVERLEFSWRLSVLTALLLAGLVLVHYRVVTFYVAFMLPYTLLLLVHRPRQLLPVIMRFALVAGMAALFVAPWLVEMVRRVLLPIATGPASLAGSESYNNLDWVLLTFGNNAVLYWITGIGIAWAAFLRQWRVLALGGWIVVLLLIANPAIFGLRSLWLINNHSVVITLFMPVSILVGYGVDRLARFLLRSAPIEVALIPLSILLVYFVDQLLHWRQLPSLTAALANSQQSIDSYLTNSLGRAMARVLIGFVVYSSVGLVLAYGVTLLLPRLFDAASTSRLVRETALALTGIGILALGTWQLRSVVNPVTVIATAPDMEAVEWAMDHTPTSARFLINTTPWLNGAYRATDGGWWLLPLGGRWVSVPPALYIYGTPAYKQAIESINQQVRALKPTDVDQLKRLIRDEGITHVFIGTNPGPIKPDMLFGDPDFSAVYDADGVAIFEVGTAP